MAPLTRRSGVVGEARSRGGRKRHRSDYERLADDDDEIEFLVPKRQKCHSERPANGHSEPSVMKKKAGSKNQKIVVNQLVINDEDDDEDEDDFDTREYNRRSPNGFLLPDPLPKGQILVDNQKRKWKLGKPIGVGGFGELYCASAVGPHGKRASEDFIVKVEPHSNGPLFVEVNFYLRCCQSFQIEDYMIKKGLSHLGVPKFVGSGSHVNQKHKLRFLVMERYGSDLQEVLDNSSGRSFNNKTCCGIAIQGSNLLVGLGAEGQHKVFLVDFGLCGKFLNGAGLHKPYMHNRRWAHEGTAEYASRDLHIGSASRRGDLEVLLYNLIEWLGGNLPWDRDTHTMDQIKTTKFMAFKTIHNFLSAAFQGGAYPVYLGKFMQYINTLHFEDKPNYELLRRIFRKGVVSSGGQLDGKLDFSLDMSPSAQTNGSAVPQNKVNSWLKTISLEDRASAVFDGLCVSHDVWRKQKDDLEQRENTASLANPTPAMLEIIKKRARNRDFKRRSKSPAVSRWSDKRHSLPTSFRIRTRSRVLNKAKERRGSREIQRLSSFLTDSLAQQRRRTRSVSGGDRDLRLNLRAALQVGMGHVRGLVRRVSDTLTSFF